MKKFTLMVSLVLGLVLISSKVNAVPVIYGDEATFQSALTSNSLNYVEYDFEASSGFPNPTVVLPIDPNDNSQWADIGTFDGIVFDASVFDKPPLALSGEQVLTGPTGGATPTFAIASIDFSAQPTHAFGFYGLDLTSIGNEVIVVEVDYNVGTDVTYTFGLGGEPRLTPIYFGVFENSDTILGIQLYGTGDGGGNRAWAIDDMTIERQAVPEPSTLLLFGTGLIGIGIFRRKFKV